MNMLLQTLVILVALLHIYFLVLEMFLWTKPIGLKTFALKPDFAAASAGLAKNQGLYNGFLSAGLISGLLMNDPNTAHAFLVFFLSCVVIAGAYGGITIKPKIFIIQGIPALLALILAFFLN